MSSPEVEEFKVTQDDLENEFLPRRYRQTKNQATYGIWADRESDEEDNVRVGFGGGKSRSKKDFSAPIGFVSGGFKQGSKIVKPDEDSDSDREVDEAEIMQMVGRKQKEKQSGRSSGRAYVPAHRSEKDFGEWEKHTKGIGRTLLKRMGYEEGKGLGKTAQGITTPVEAFKRKGRAAVGAYGTERTARSLKDFPQHDSEEEEEKQFKDELSQWKKKPEAGKKKPKYVYKTAQEAIETGGKKRKVVTGASSKIKVIDMTGKEKRVLTGYHSISQRHDRPEEEEDIYEEPSKTDKKKAFDVPELMHNLNLLVDMAEEDIIQNDRKLKYEKDSLVNMKYESERLNEVCDREAKQIDRLQKVLDVVQCCEERMKPGCDNPLTLDECINIFKKLQDDYYEEYKMYDLPTLAIALVFPMMREFLSKWDPMKNPTYGVNTIQEWQYLLEDGNKRFTQDLNNMDIYQKLIWDVWLPIVRTVVLKWNVRDYDPLITLLETWMPALPRWIMENILDQLVLPKLLQEVENWNPLTDTTPVHAWLHPWLPLMGDKLEQLYAPIRHKLANALTNWHPSDTSAKVILQPWIGVFKLGHMDAFVIKNILPKLALCMQDFSINPNQQVLDQWHWMLAWKDIIPLHSMTAMLMKTFFPKWIQVLCSWLANMPNYEEITRWYVGWKSQFPEEWLAHPQIKDQFNRALDIMNRAVSGHLQPGAKENMAYFTLTERRQMERQMESQPRPTPTHDREFDVSAVRSVDTSIPNSFKDLVFKKAEENDILCMPIQGKTHEAKQLYKFGKVVMYMDRNVIFMSENQAWIPVSLQNLLNSAL